jgi:hypothetical protein
LAERVPFFGPGLARGLVAVLLAAGLAAADEAFARPPALARGLAALARGLAALELREVPVEALLAEDSSEALPQRPDNTRSAASATASAMIEPRRVALLTAALAALLAVSAASRPASRILRRAAGLALIAAAAAARPAASISRLIAAFAILSTVLPPDLDELEEELFFLPDFAILHLLLSNQRHFKAVTVPYHGSKPLAHANSSDVQRLVAKRWDMVPLS